MDRTEHSSHWDANQCSCGLATIYSLLRYGPSKGNDVGVFRSGHFSIPIAINLLIIFLFLLARSEHNIVSSRPGDGKVQVGNRKREIILSGVLGTQAWIAWNCRWTQPFVSAKRGLSWTTHHLTPEACSRKISTEAGMEHELTDLDWLALAAILLMILMHISGICKSPNNVSLSKFPVLFLLFLLNSKAK